MLGSLALALSLISSGAGLSSKRDESSAVEKQERVYGGNIVNSCAWPTTLSIGNCSATLVHPKVAITAAHCFTNTPAGPTRDVTFGDTTDDAARVIQASCTRHPNYTSGEEWDIAVCVLESAQEDVPIVPILMGCDVNAITPGKGLYVVGFGRNDIDAPDGTKVEVEAAFNNWTEDNGAFVGGDGKDSCKGDSGGPVYAQMPDKTWRVFGVTSWGGDCGTGGYYAVMHEHIAWLEGSAGIDITPCHEADGTWSPTSYCNIAPLKPGIGGGTWDDGCGDGIGAIMGAHRECGGADPDGWMPGNDTTTTGGDTTGDDTTDGDSSGDDTTDGDSSGTGTTDDSGTTDSGTTDSGTTDDGGSTDSGATGSDDSGTETTDDGGTTDGGSSSTDDTTDSTESTGAESDDGDPTTGGDEGTGSGEGQGEEQESGAGENSEGGESDGETGGDEEGVTSDSDGCDCRTSESEPVTAGVLLFGLLWWRRSLPRFKSL